MPEHREAVDVEGAAPRAVEPAGSAAAAAVSPSAGAAPSVPLRELGQLAEKVMFVSESAADAAATPSRAATVSSAAGVERRGLPKPAMRRDWLISVESAGGGAVVGAELEPPGPRPSPSSGGVGSCATVRSVPTP